MKRAKQPTPYLLIKANNRSGYDPVNFALVHITPEWLKFLSLNLQAIRQFRASKAFHCFSYWDAPLGYYYISDQEIAAKGIMLPHEDQAFIKLEAGEPALWVPPEDKLEAEQLLITTAGIAHYKAYARGTGAEYWTAEFNLIRLMKPFIN